MANSMEKKILLNPEKVFNQTDINHDDKRNIYMYLLTYILLKFGISSKLFRQTTKFYCNV